MSGQLVGEAIAASPQLRACGLSRNGFLALIAIAEKASNGDREASVRWSHLQDGLYGVSVKTARRAVKELEQVGLIRVVSAGWANQHGASRAPIYEVRIGTPVSTSTNRIGTPVSTSTNRIGTPVSTSSGVDVDKSKLDVDKSKLDVDTVVPLTSADISLDGSFDGSIDGARARGQANRPTGPPSPGSGNAPKKSNPKTKTKNRA